MDDLAADLRMSKKTLYACFPSKSSLVEAVLKDKFNEVETDFSRLASEDSSDMEKAIHHFLHGTVHDFLLQIGFAELKTITKHRDIPSVLTEPLDISLCFFSETLE